MYSKPKPTPQPEERPVEDWLSIPPDVDVPCWVPSDCWCDPEDPYNPCGPHHKPKP